MLTVLSTFLQATVNISSFLRGLHEQEDSMNNVKKQAYSVASLHLVGNTFPP